MQLRFRAQSSLSPLQLARRLRREFERGGLLLKTFGYDSALFALVMLSAAAAALHGQHANGAGAWRTGAILYWLRALYGLCSLPFVLFKLPVLGNVLTRTRGVGYDELGRTRYHERAPFCPRNEGASS